MCQSAKCRTSPDQRKTSVSAQSTRQLPRACYLIDFDFAAAQLDLGLFNLLLELGVRFGDVVEIEDRETKSTEQVACEANQGVKGKLMNGN